MASTQDRRNSLRLSDPTHHSNFHKTELLNPIDDDDADQKQDEILDQAANTTAMTEGLVNNDNPSSPIDANSDDAGLHPNQVVDQADMIELTTYTPRRTRVTISQDLQSNTQDEFPNRLPEGFSGANGLKMPPYLSGPVSSVTLPSRLDLLGRRSFKLLAAIKPVNIGNSVLGYAPFLRGCNLVFGQLFILPWIFSKAAARMNLFVRTVLLAIFVILLIGFFGGTTVQPGRAWVIGTSVATFVMYKLATFRRSPDGVMAFCRSMGAPEVEEYMFSYCWKVQPDNVRTLAKAVWNSGVGVWIDVVKLCPGDEIRPMLRTTINRVYRVVVFLCPEYCASPNCCVEMMEAAQTPEKLIFCILKPLDPGVNKWLHETMKPKGSVICNGFSELIQQLDIELQDTADKKPWLWWRDQKISGAGVPTHVVPSNNWDKIPRFSLVGKLFPPDKSLTVGPIYLAGDCKSRGSRFWPPWLFLLAVFAVCWNVGDMVLKFTANDVSSSPTVTNVNHNNNPPIATPYPTAAGATTAAIPTSSSVYRSPIDFLWLGVIACVNLAPIFGLKNLLETRRDLHVALKPLLASRALGGVKVRIIGGKNDAIATSLKQFLNDLNHLPANDTLEPVSIQEHLEKDGGGGGGGEGRRGTREDSSNTSASPDAERVVTVFVMNSIEDRDALFASESLPFDKYSLFVWSGKGDPFTPDVIGKRLMRFLVLVASWDKFLLAENLFSAIGVRVVDILHGE